MVAYAPITATRIVPIAHACKGMTLSMVCSSFERINYADNLLSKSRGKMRRSFTMQTCRLALVHCAQDEKSLFRTISTRSSRGRPQVIKTLKAKVCELGQSYQICKLAGL